VQFELSFKSRSIAALSVGDEPLRSCKPDIIVKAHLLNLVSVLDTT